MRVEQPLELARRTADFARSAKHHYMDVDYAHHADDMACDGLEYRTAANGNLYPVRSAA